MAIFWLSWKKKKNQKYLILFDHILFFEYLMATNQNIIYNKWMINLASVQNSFKFKSMKLIS